MLAKSKKGFTLMELMVVIAIIGVLAASLFPALTGYLSRARDTKKIAEIKELNTALITYQIDKSTYHVLNTGGDGGGQGWINLKGNFGTVTYPETVFQGLKNLGYIANNIKQKTVIDWTNDPITHNTAPCAVSFYKDLYMLYFDDSTGKYAISGYLENSKQSDIDNIVLSFRGVGGVGTCTTYGRNYAVGNN